MEKEIWKDIEGFEGMYQVSNLGHVRSLKFGREMILKPRNHVRGYLNVNLCKDGQSREITVHKLVAEAFLPRPVYPKELDAFDGTEYDYELEVNHKDENKKNNSVENLEWCLHRYNTNYGTRTERQKASRKKHQQEAYEHRFDEPIPDGTVLLWD